MRYLLTIFILHYGFLYMWGQPGFNQKYDLGESMTTFFQCSLVEENTLAVYGLAYSDEVFLHQQGLVFAKIDTNGNVLSHRLYFDSLGYEYAVNLPASFIKLKDGSGYMLLAQILENYNGVLLKTDNEGNLISKFEFEDTIALSKFYKKIIEINNYFYISGVIQSQNYQTDIFIIKIDRKGNKLWEKSYGLNSRREYLTSFYVANENEFIFGGIIVNSIDWPDYDKTEFGNKIFAIDSLGIIKWNWEGALSKISKGDEHDVTGLYKSNGRDYRYTTIRSQYNVTEDAFYHQPSFIIRDSNFNLIFEKPVGTLQKHINGFSHSFPTQDGGWLAVGEANTTAQLKSFTGWMYRLDTKGDSLWSRFDTAQAPGPWGGENVFFSAAELPSGSIIACGYSDRLGGSKTWGWLLKVDQNGCMDTLHCYPISSTIEPNEANKSLRIFPNPVLSTFRFIDETQTKWDWVEVTNVLGQTIFKIPHPVNNEIDLSLLKSGVYFVRFVKLNLFMVKTIVKT
jgi:hypothetical protein